MLFPMDPEKFWEQMRHIIREEVSRLEKVPKSTGKTDFQVAGLTYKPLYKMAEICSMFNISRPTIYDWVKHGKLKPFKIRSRVYFLWNDIQQLLNSEST